MHGRIAVQIRSPVTTSPSARHWLSTSQTLLASMSYLRNTSTRSCHGAGTSAMPTAKFRSTTVST
jgi:hypothetical protein